VHMAPALPGGGGLEGERAACSILNQPWTGRVRGHVDSVQTTWRDDGGGGDRVNLKKSIVKKNFSLSSRIVRRRRKRGGGRKGTWWGGNDVGRAS